MSELNPFAVNRAEYMRDLWKYYDYAQESPVCSRGVRSATIYNVSQYLI